jgi:hypothetical protein
MIFTITNDKYLIQPYFIGKIMSRNANEWLQMLKESVETKWSDEDAEKLIEQPKVGDCVNFHDANYISRRGIVTSINGNVYKMDVDGEIFTTSSDHLLDKCEAGEISESSPTNSTKMVKEFVHEQYTYRIYSDPDYRKDEKNSKTQPKYSIRRIASGQKWGGISVYFLMADDEWVLPVDSAMRSATTKYFDSVGEAYSYITTLSESMLKQALSTKRIIAALAVTLGLSTSAHAGLLTQMAAAVEDAAPKVGATIIAKAQEAATMAGEQYDKQAPKVVSAAKDAATATKDAIAKYGPKIIDAAKDAGMTTADYAAKYYNEKSPEVIAGAKQLGMSTAEYIKLQTPEVISAAKKAGVKTSDYLADKYSEHSPSVYDGAKKIGKQSMQSASDAGEDIAARSKRAAAAFAK